MLFKKRKRWVIMRLDIGGYYAGNQQGTASVWTPNKENAIRFTSDEAFSARLSLVHIENVRTVALED